jgi:hypothetical protein
MSLETVIRPVTMLQQTSQREVRSSNRGLVTPAIKPGLVRSRRTIKTENVVQLENSLEKGKIVDSNGKGILAYISSRMSS